MDELKKMLAGVDPELVRVILMEGADDDPLLVVASALRPDYAA